MFPEKEHKTKKRAIEKGILFNLLIPDFIEITHKIISGLVHWGNPSQSWPDSTSTVIQY